MPYKPISKDPKIQRRREQNRKAKRKSRAKVKDKVAPTSKPVPPAIKPTAPAPGASIKSPSTPPIAPSTMEGGQTCVSPWDTCTVKPFKESDASAFAEPPTPPVPASGNSLHSYQPWDQPQYELDPFPVYSPEHGVERPRRLTSSLFNASGNPPDVEELFDGFDIEPPEATPQSQPPTTPDSSASTEVATPSGSNASSNGISSVIERSVALLAFKVKVESKVTKNRTFIESRKTKLELKKKQRELSNYCTLGS